MVLWHIVVVAIILVHTTVYATVVQYNTSVDCSSAPCDLGLPGIWIGGKPPTANDTVEIYPPKDGKVYDFAITINTTVFQNLYVQNSVLNVVANFQVSQNITATDCNVVISNNATLTLSTAAFFMGSSNVSVLQDGIFLGFLSGSSSACVYFDAPSTFNIDGTVVILLGNMELYGAITMSATADVSSFGNTTYAPRYTSINSVPYFYSAIIPNNSDYIFPQGASFEYLTIGANANVTLMNTASINNFNDPAATLTIKAGGILNLIDCFNDPNSFDSISLPSGEGSIHVHSSSLLFVGTAEYSSSPAVPLFFSGPNNTAFFLDSILQYISFSDDAYINFIATELTLINEHPPPLYIPGAIVVGNGSLILNGSFSFNGGLVGDVAYIESIGSDISFGAEVILYGSASYDELETYISIWNLSSSLTTPKLTLYNSSIIQASDDLQINGDVDNYSGVLQLDGNTIVKINGNYFQHAKGSFTLMGLDATLNSTRNTTARLTVSKSAFIAGEVQYTYTSLPNHSKWPILHTLNGTINGTFANKATAITGSIETLDFDYRTPNLVYIVYNHSNSKKWGPLMWYYWLVIGGGTLLVVGVLVLIVVRARRRTNYVAVRGY